MRNNKSHKIFGFKIVWPLPCLDPEPQMLSVDANWSFHLGKKSLDHLVANN